MAHCEWPGLAGGQESTQKQFLVPQTFMEPTAPALAHPGPMRCPEGMPPASEGTKVLQDLLFSKGIALRLLSKKPYNLLFQPLEFTKSPLASDLIDLFGTSVGLLLTQT